mgnify:CR=1 FL=1
MIRLGRGHIINIGSTAGHMTYPRGNVYAATKFAVRALTEGMSLDVRNTPIRISSVDPGYVRTEFAPQAAQIEQMRTGEIDPISVTDGRTGDPHLLVDASSKLGVVG